MAKITTTVRCLNVEETYNYIQMVLNNPFIEVTDVKYLHNIKGTVDDQYVKSKVLINTNHIIEVTP